MIERAKTDDVAAAAQVLADAFATHLNMIYFFGGDPASRQPLVREFFDILLSARIALQMPVFFAKLEGRIAGAVMGYDTNRPEWPAQYAKRWADLEARVDGFSGRIGRQDEAVHQFKPKHPHYYLGVIGIDPGFQGKGVGSALIERFCASSDADKASSGTYLETTNPDNAAYYQRIGFISAGTAELDPATRIWTLFRPAPPS